MSNITANAETTRASLERLRTSDLWKAYTKAGLGVTREKNRTWVIDQILNAKPAQAAEEAPAEDAETATANEAAEASTEAPETEPTNDQAETTEAPTEPEAPATEAVETDSGAADTDNDNDTDEEAEAPAVNPLDFDTDSDEAGTDLGADLADTAGGKAPLTKMTVDELRAAYVEEVGRATKSDNRGYLIWKIREARKGKVPVGPTQRPPKRDPNVKMMVLPLRMSEPTVEALDAAWKRLGFKSRMDFIRAAMATVLTDRGEAQAAEDIRND